MIMPCYNAEAHIDTMLASVYAQLHDDIELICVDDGSTDNTRSKLDAWKPLMEKRGYSMVIMSKENGGAASAINAGLGLMTGAYVCFPDNDDFLMPGYVSKMLAFLDANPHAKWAKCGFIQFYWSKRGTIITNSQADKYSMNDDAPFLVELFIARRVPAAVWTCMIRVDFFQRCFPDMKLEEGGWAIQEHQIQLPLAAQAPYAYLDEPLYFWKQSNTYLNRYFDVSYSKGVVFHENMVEISRKLARKLVDGNRLGNCELICDIVLNYYNIRLATKHGQYETKKNLTDDLYELIKPILNDTLPLSYDVFSNYVELFSGCAMEKLIYPKEILIAKASPQTRALLEDIYNKRVFMYGAGEVGRFLLPLLVSIGIKVECVWDKNAENLNSHLQYIPVSLPNFNEFNDREKQDGVIVIGIKNPVYVSEVFQMLKESGFNKIIFADDLYKMLREKFTGVLTI